MTVGLLIEIGAQSRCVDQVSVVGEAEAVRGVDVEGLAFGALERTC